MSIIFCFFIRKSQFIAGYNTIFCAIVLIPIFCNPDTFSLVFRLFMQPLFHKNAKKPFVHRI